MEATLEFSDYVSYWLQFFPEINSPREFDEILKNVSQASLEKLSKAMEKEEDCSYKELTDLIFACPRVPLLGVLREKIKETFPYYYFMDPVLNLALFKHYGTIMESNILDGADTFWENIITQLSLILFRLAERTIILEINVAREENILVGGDSKDRFLYFTDVLLQDPIYRRRLYSEYHGLIKLLYNKTCGYLAFVAELLKNTEAELPAIAKKFGGDSLGKVIAITIGMGDAHRGGKTVSVITFANGTKIVYKPRRIELEESFQELLKWQGTRFPGLLENKTIMVHCGKECGWVEFLDYQDCKDATEVERFYVRIGQLMCLLYSLNAKDFHHENVLAVGEYPVLLDLESLFHSNQGLAYDDDGTALARATGILGKSVYSTGLLPQKITNPSDLYSDKSIDVSGLGGGVAQMSPFQSLNVVDDNTDRIRLENRFGSIEPKANSPRVEGEIQSSLEHACSIKKGFISMYQCLMENKDCYIELIKKLFSGAQNRFILRPTFMYAQLLATSYHPDFLREPIHRWVLLHRIGIGGNNDGRQILASELNDLLAGEVPLFNNFTDSQVLLDSQGNNIYGLIDKTPLEEVFEKVSDLGQEDLDFQVQIIDTAFAVKDTDSRKDATFVSFDLSLQTNRLTPSRWLKLAEDIGDYIIGKGISGQCNGKSDMTWLGTILEGRDELVWSLAPVGLDLYNGNSGIALFLGYLGALSGKNRFTEAAFQAASSLCQRIQGLNTEHPYAIGAFNGISGYFYTLVKLWQLTKDTELKEFIVGSLATWKGLLRGDKLFDVIGGSAGSLAVLFSMAGCLGEEADKDIAEMIDLSYNHIAANSRDYPLGISWGLGSEHVPYSGFAHGNAGIAATLARYHVRTNDVSALELISRTLELERGLYSPEHRNWFPSLAKDRISSGWCHGAPGILLSKVILYEAGYVDSQLQEEISCSLETTMSSLGFNTSLCHGDLGNIAILKYASRILTKPKIDNAASATFQTLFDSVLQTRWKDGLFRGTESLGLMVGLAGAGYALLRHFDPETVPEILALD